jgi:UDP-2,3-diacylglucosamine hydrolase
LQKTSAARHSSASCAKSWVDPSNPLPLTLAPGKKIYFNSDYHLGVPDYAQSRVREDKVVQWLDNIKADAEEVWLLGDLFDFWFEYKYVVPKGHVRLLGKIAELTGLGIRVHIFVGNHDLWMKDYLPTELGVKVHRDTVIRDYNGKLFFIHHGDGKGPGDKGFKLMKKAFTNPFFQWCFKWLHPDIGIGLANFFSGQSGKKTREKDAIFLGEDKEWLVQYARRKLTGRHYDYFIFGHRHLPLEINIGENSTYYNLGDWITYFTYGVFDGEKFSLEKF